jgi:crotonobetaine/carnitine-CoA ligase
MAGPSGNEPTFAREWANAVGAGPARTFLLWQGADGAVRTWTYGEFGRLVDEVAHCLSGHGARAGRTVHVALTNSPAFIAVWLACTQLGAVLVPSDPAATSRELAECFSRTSPVIGIASARRPADYRAAAAGMAMQVISVDEDDTDLQAIRAEPRPARHDRPEPAPGQPLAIMFTSGTTSRPKGVILTQANYAFAGRVMARAAALGRDDRQLVVLPVFHANAQYYSFAPAIHVGASVALMHTFSASGFVRQAAEHQATHASLFAAPIRMILARTGARPGGLRLRHCWYAQNLTSGQYEQIASLLGCRPRQLYGMTETVPAVITSDPEDALPDAMGRQTPGCQVDLQDPASGRRTAVGQAGEIVAGGRPGAEIFAGYLDDPETTAGSFRDGWFRTGDLAIRDSAGVFRFAGRRGDLLKVAGENVSTVEIEAVLAEHPAVYESAVVGEPDPVRDEVPVAYVVLRDGHSATAQELGSWCAERLARSKRPREYRLVAELPRTSVGKIRKYMLGATAAHGQQAGRLTRGGPGHHVPDPGRVLRHFVPAPRDVAVRPDKGEGCLVKRAYVAGNVGRVRRDTGRLGTAQHAGDRIMIRLSRVHKRETAPEQVERRGTVWQVSVRCP